ncbi:MAG: universal stress protein [Nitriliruptorales bacterium]|nr:universal stress protein [Nitriliruptorales bacterium]
MTGTSRQGELERTLGLREATTIGLGTMIGAGIFVFPGIAAGRAGPGAVLSFALGAVIALLVALPASELATAMPQSGGGYYFVSRGLGALAGAVVGIGQWIGLMFASAFYLVGFGHYLNGLLAEAGLDARVSVLQLGVIAGVVLTVVAIAGAEKTGKLQNNLVGILVAVFAGFLGYGMLDALGVVGRVALPDEFLPFGAAPVLATAALVFTSYLGFAQIATVAGDIKDPGRNLPRAMVGSVVAVGVLYVLMIVVSTSAFESATLGSFGETAAVEVARRLLGLAGALVITGAGLLATLSSANASIMSASRAVYALSRDELFPERAAEVSQRFGTPHLAVLLAGIPTVLLVISGRTETLAEVASFLHLVMYGLMCVALLALRRRKPAWYAPEFHTPGYPVVPALGAIASFGLIAFMGGWSIVIGAAVLLMALAWHLVYARGVTIAPGERAEKAAPSPLEGAQVLVPVLLPDPDPLPRPLQRLLRGLDLVVLGIYEVRKQTAVEQARRQFGDEAEDVLDDWLEPLRGHGGRTDSRLVFSQTPLDTIERVGAEQETDAILVPRPLGEEQIEQILVPVRGDPNARRIARFVTAVADEVDGSVLLLHVAHPEEADEARVTVVSTFLEQLAEQGLADERVESLVVSSEDPEQVIVEHAERNHLVVVGESDPDDPDVVLGELPRRLASRVRRPVLVTRTPRD